MRGLATGAAVLAALGALCCRASGEKPGLVFLPDMYQSVPYDAYDPNTLTPSGQTLLLPPEGTIPMGWTPFAFGPGPDEAQRAGAQLVNTMPATPENLARGKRVFDTICIVCHGAKGLGDGPIIGRFPNPPSLLAARARKLPDGRIYHIIAHGQGIMPAHAVQVLPNDRWRAILHIRQLQVEASVSEPAGAVVASTGGAGR